MKKVKNRYLILILLFLVIGISVGYAALTTTLNINGSTTIEKASWDIHFENLVKDDDSVVATVDASIDSTKSLIEYTVMLAEPGDFYEFNVDIVNNGTIDAMISEVLKTGLSSEQEKYIEYTATYSDGINIEENDLLKSGTSENIKVSVKYKEDIVASDLPTEDNLISLSFSIVYVQADEDAKIREKLICKRATTLHTEECTQKDNNYYCSGAGYTTTGSKKTTTITYGNLGTLGADPVSGDAFDCDVNGDGKYDNETERFYFVNNLDSNDKYAMLIYYNNVSAGIPSSSSNFAYNVDVSSYLGPQTAILQLPLSSQWKNVSLFNSYRDILDINDNIKVNKFNYSGYAARMLSLSELEKACGVTVGSYATGELDNCNYLLENTHYSSSSVGTAGYWLETYFSTDSHRLGLVYGHSRDVSSNLSDYSDGCGVRPVIEVLKDNMYY